METVLALAADILVMGGLAASPASARQVAEHRLRDGSAADRFGRMVTALGGPRDLVDNPGRYIADAPVIRPVFLGKSGFVRAMDCYAIGIALLSIGAGRTRPQDDIDHSVGASCFASVGSLADATHPFCILHAPSEASWHRCASAIEAAVECSEFAMAPSPVIRLRLTSDNL
jgi:thymidine phosphorylase